MSRLKQLADSASALRAAITACGQSNPQIDEDLRDLAALLRAASAETVGTEWAVVCDPDDESENINDRCGSRVNMNHNADLHAARLAIADLRAERDAKQRAIDEVFDVLDAGHGMLACREAAHILRPHATKATEANSSATVTGSTACCADCDLVFRNAYGLDKATPAADACDTRELVARLAEFIHTRWTKPGSAHDWRPELEAIIAAARRGGGG